jgi:lipid II:glycine glycyltransferase (peptidoglycan interpeptide bridge formation enzyme)
MINWAIQNECKTFNFMTSSPDQRSLVKYKEKWGGITKEHITYELHLNKLTAKFFVTVSRLLSLVRA